MTEKRKTLSKSVTPPDHPLSRFTLEAISKTTYKPPIFLVYGDAGVGKSTLASEAEKPIFVQCEEGLNGLGVDSFPLAKKLDDVYECLKALALQDHNFLTVVIDSIDWLEQLIHRHICKHNDVESIEDLPYGKGYQYALEEWIKIRDKLTYLREEKGMVILLIAHSQIRTVTDPLQAPYDRHTIKLHKKSSALLEEYCDIILFMAIKMAVKETKDGFNTHNRAVSSGERIVYTDNEPTHTAKNRYKLPRTMPADFKKIINTIKPQGK